MSRWKVKTYQNHRTMLNKKINWLCLTDLHCSFQCGACTWTMSPAPASVVHANPTPSRWTYRMVNNFRNRFFNKVKVVLMFVAEDNDSDTRATHCWISLRVHRYMPATLAVALFPARSIILIVAETSVVLDVLAAQPAIFAAVSNMLLQFRTLSLAFPFLLLLWRDWAFISKVLVARFCFNWLGGSEGPVVFCVLVELDEKNDIFLILFKFNGMFTAKSHTCMKVEKNQFNWRGLILWLELCLFACSHSQFSWQHHLSSHEWWTFVRAGYEQAMRDIISASWWKPWHT